MPKGRHTLHASAPCATLPSEHGLGCSHHDPPSAPRGLPSRCWASPHTHTCPCRRVQPRGTSCSSRLQVHPAVAVAWVCARGVVRHGHDTTSGRDALTVAPVRPQGLPQAVPTQDRMQPMAVRKGYGTLRPPVRPWAMAWARRSPSFSRCGRTASKAEASSAGPATRPR